MNRGGWSQLEVLIVVSMAGVLMTQVVPHFMTAVESVRVDYCAAQLDGVALGQRMYRLETGTFATSLAELSAAGLIRVDALADETSFQYTIESASTDSYCCRGNRVGSNTWEGSFTVDQGGAISVAVSDTGGQVLAPAQ